MSIFKLDGTEYEIKLGYRLTITVLPEKFGIDLNGLFVNEDAASSTMEALILDDKKSLDLAWFFIEPSASFDYDHFLDLMGGKLDQFRDKFWEEVVNFSGVLKKDMMKSIWIEFKKDLKGAKFLDGTSTSSPSVSNPEE